MDLVLFEVSDGVATIRLDRPKLNALNAEMQARLAQLANECGERSDIAAVVITGGEHNFAAGADIKQMLAMTAEQMAEHSHVLQAAFAAVATIPKPVVAAINGYALGGGCELALCADVRFAAEDAVLGQPEIKLGIIPGAGGTQRLTRLVGPSRAKELIFTGRFVPAEEALSIGLVDRVLPAGEVLEAATGWARPIRRRTGRGPGCGQTRDRRRPGSRPRRRPRARASGFRRPLRDRGSEDRHAGFRRSPAAQLHRPVSGRNPQSTTPHESAHSSSVRRRHRGHRVG